MFIGKIEGSVVATKKDPHFEGRPLLLVRPMLVDDKDHSRWKPGVNTIVAVDTVGAGEGEMVMFTQGGSARRAPGMHDTPVDAVIVAIVDTVDVEGKVIFKAGQ
jgi:ethanolamine utilization protein EutN